MLKRKLIRKTFNKDIAIKIMSLTSAKVQWTVEDVKKEIEKTFNKDIAIKIMSLTSAKVQT